MSAIKVTSDGALVIDGETVPQQYGWDISFRVNEPIRVTVCSYALDGNGILIEGGEPVRLESVYRVPLVGSDPA